MKLREIRPMGGGRFVSRYDLAYIMHNGREKIYEMVSRRPVKGLSDLADAAPDGVVLIILNEARSRVLLNREFRPAVGKVVYNFPAGLIDAGETAEQAAARELREETGLALCGHLATYGRSYGSVGLSNESAAVYVGLADADVPFGGNADPAEEIEPVWVSRAQAAEIIQSGAVTARVQLFLALWGTGVLG
jgi:ADP-ribose pyrophosphatase